MNKKVLQSQRRFRPGKKTIIAGASASVGAPGPKTSPELTNEQMNALSGLLLKATGHRFEYYKKTVVARRVARRMGMLGARSVDEYIASLFKNTAETVHLVNDLMIGVTGFFRDPESWETLEKEVIRPLVLQEPLNRPLRVWAPACSTGEEAYTIAMAFQRQMERAGKSRPLNVFATDINDKALSRGRLGVYPAGVTNGMPPEFMRRYFTRLDGGARARISKDVRDMVVFAKQNILTDPPFSRLDLIVCRNLFIYLEPSVQEKLLGLFHYALKPGGFLFLGSAESIGRRCGFFKPLPGKNGKIYKRTGHEKPIGTAYSFNLLSARRDGARAGKTPLQCDKAIEAIAQKALLEKYAPAAVVITASQEILYYNGPTADYLAQPGGAPTHNILDLVPENMRNRMRRLISRSVHENRPVTLSMAFAGNGKDSRKVFVEVRPLDRTLEAEPLFCIAFSQQDAKTTPTETIPDSCGPDEPLIRQLEMELANTRDELLTNVEQEKSLNEELHSSNEELQAANEEMETSREELQTLNEELTTANSQLQFALAEQEKAEESLKKSEEFFKLVTTNTPDHVIVQDAGLRYEMVINPQLGLTEQEMTGKTDYDFLSKSEADTLTGIKKKVLDTGDSEHVETPLTARDGSIQYFQGSYIPRRSAEGRINGVIGYFRNVTGQKKAEEALQTALLRLQTLVSSMHGSILFVGETKVELVNQNFCNYFGLQEHPGDLIGLAPAEMIEKIKNAYLNPDEQVSRIHEIVARGQPVIGEEINMTGTRTCLRDFIPIYTEGKPFGRLWYHIDISHRKKAEEALREAQKRTAAILEGIADTYYSLDNQWRFTAVNPAAERAPFGRPAAELLGKIIWDMYPKLVGTPIHRHYLDAAGKRSLEHYTAQSPLNGRWYEVFMQGWKNGVDVYMRDITERKEAEEALALSNRKLTEVLESIQDDFYVLDRNWKFLFASRRFTSRIGKGPKDFIGKGIWEMFPKHVGTAFEENLRSTMEKGEVRRFEIGGKYTQAWYRMASFPSVEGVIVLGTEITEQKRMEEALRQSEEKYKDLVENANSIIIKMNEKGEITFFNDYAQKFFGYSLNEIIGKNVKILVPNTESVTGRDLNEMSENILENPDKWSENVNENRLKNGELVWVSWRNKALRDSGGNIVGNLAVGQDITERRKVDEALRQSEERFKAIAETTPVGIGVVGLPEAVLLYVNPAYEKGFGYAKDELLGRGAPDIYWDQAERDAILGILKERGNVAEYEVRLKHKDGTMFWGLSSVRPITFNGKAALLGSFTDITGRKKVEAALRETKDYLENLIQYANAPIIVWDPAMRVTRFNGGFERLTGYKAREVLGANLSMLFPEEGRDASLKIIRRALSGEYWEWVEIPILCKDGLIRLALWNSANIYAEDGETLLATIAQGTDITERKQAEEAVTKQAEELRRNNEELERFNRISVDRELRMIELKNEVNDLLGLSGAPARYKTEFEKE